MYNSGSAPRLVFGRQGGGWDAGYGGDLTLSYDPAVTEFLTAPGDVNGDGYDDIVLRNASLQAYLIYGAASMPTAPTPAATLDAVGLVASTPYAAGADINGDGSSDLLIVPTGTGNATDSTASVASFQPGAYDVTVDDDYCDTCVNDGLTWQVNAFATLGDALAAARPAWRAAMGCSASASAPAPIPKTSSCPAIPSCKGLGPTT